MKVDIVMILCVKSIEMETRDSTPKNIVEGDTEMSRRNYFFFASFGSGA